MRGPVHSAPGRNSHSEGCIFGAYFSVLTEYAGRLLTPSDVVAAGRDVLGFLGKRLSGAASGKPLRRAFRTSSD